MPPPTRRRKKFKNNWKNTQRTLPKTFTGNDDVTTIPRTCFQTRNNNNYRHPHYLRRLLLYKINLAPSLLNPFLLLHLQNILLPLGQTQVASQGHLPFPFKLLLPTHQLQVRQWDFPTRTTATTSPLTATTTTIIVW